MKPFYSILELSDLFDDSPDHIVTALIASGVTIFRNGKPCDENDLAPLNIPRTFHIDANGFSRTANLLVASEPLPETWKHVLMNASGPDKTSEYESNDLRLLRLASFKFWANADKSDRTTHSNNDDVIAWLETKGMSARKAQAGAAIIRPEWAAKGRRPND